MKRNIPNWLKPKSLKNQVGERSEKLANGRTDQIYGVLKVVLKFTFPDRDNGPADGSEVSDLALVAFDVAGKFGLPKFAVGLWQVSRAFGAAVPEAAMDEDG